MSWPRVHAALRGLSPGYFAMAMASGIISFELEAQQFPVLSTIFLVITILTFVVLCGLTTWRFLAHRADFVEDFAHPLRGFGFYAFVAAADVLATRIARGHGRIAVALLVVGAAAWLARGYAVPWTTRLGRGEHPIVAAANGTWFMWAVGGQSIAVAAATLAFYRGGHVLPLVAMIAWSLGLFLYAVDGVFVAMRLLAYEFTAEDLTPPYWVAMGAAAITTLAAARIAALPPGPFLDSVRELARGSGLLMWAVASWLVPALFAMGWWRHVTHRVPLVYDAGVWSIVFPLGMYAAASTELARTEHLPWLGDIAAVWIWVAVAAWVLAFAGLCVHSYRTVRPRTR